MGRVITAQRRLHFACAAWVMALCAGACEACWPGPYEVELGTLERGRRTPGREDASVPVLPWGVYAAGLDVGACLPSPSAPLVVDTAAAEPPEAPDLADPAAAGAHLSVLEALTIAANRPGQDTVLFDLEVFPTDAPGRILIDTPPPVGGRYAVSEVCVDGRGRGVEVEWADHVAGDPRVAPATWRFQQSSLVVGLRFIKPPEDIEVSRSQLAGCDIAFNGLAGVDAAEAVIGPGNFFHNLWPSGFALDVDVTSGASTTVRHNAFSYDPRSGEQIDDSYSLSLRGAVSLVGNVVATPRFSIFSYGDQIRLAGNDFGTDWQGRVLPQKVYGLYLLTVQGAMRVGPGNRVRNALHGAYIDPGRSQIALSRNSISGCDEGITFTGEARHPPPEITTVAAGLVAGTCAIAGLVELFNDPADQGETFLGDAACSPEGGWELSLALPEVGFLTATLTAGGVTSAFSTPVAVR